MLALVLAVVSFIVLLAELWTGIAVTGFSGDQMVVERATKPGPYWFTMALHTAVAVGLPALAFLTT